VGEKELGEAERRGCHDDDVDDADATMQIGGSLALFFVTAERHREDSRRRGVAMVLNRREPA
jgi:hypothetical protein